MSISYKEKLKEKGVRKEPLDKIYAEVANNIGLRPVAHKGNQWIKADGLQYVDIDKKEYIIPKGEDENRKEVIGRYSKNNGKISFVDEKGHLYVAPATEERETALKKAGYKTGGTFVPFSNGERPKDERINKKLLKMESRQMSQYEKGHLREYSQRAKDLGLKEIKSTEGWINVTGVEYYEGEGNRKGRVPKKGEELVGNVGTYCTNNGLIAFVNEKGETYVAVSTLGRENELRAAGYKKPSQRNIQFASEKYEQKVKSRFAEYLDKQYRKKGSEDYKSKNIPTPGPYVPFSNGEKPIKKSIALQLEKMYEKEHFQLRDRTSEIDEAERLDLIDNPSKKYEHIFKKKRRS